MQTLKTAAIVVLIMTVLFGAYSSLTTPTEPLPAEIESILVETGDLPSSLDMFSIDEGVVSNDPGDLDPSELDPGTLDAEGPELMLGDPSGVSGRVSDSVAALTPPATSTAPVASNANSFEIPQRPRTAAANDAATSSEPALLPPVNGTAPRTANVDPTRSYPTTPGTFALPDPNQVAGKFDSSSGTTAPANLASNDKPLDVQPIGMALPKSDNMKPASVKSSANDASKPTPTLSGQTPNLGLANAIMTADNQYRADQRKEALATLSLFYSTPNLSPNDRNELLARLDPLAGEVIYSRRHLLEQPHRVGHNETLMEIAARYGVPWQLLANINGIEDPVTVLPGTELKVVRGPFRAEIDMATSELTLFLGDLYAGRFPIATGNDPAPRSGTYTIQDKQTSRTYYDASGSPVPADSPNNPYGTVWMDLGGQLCIHGSPERTRPTKAGCVSLAGDFAEDLYGILSQGSSVTIR